MNSTVKFVCPHCRAELSLSNDSLLCDGCPRSWEMKEQIPCFVGEDFYWSEISQGQTGQVLESIRRDGWEIGAVQYIREKFPQMYGYIFQPERSNGLFLLPLSNQSTVLDIGCGFGTLSVCLSDKCKEVYAVDGGFERIMFLDFWRKFESKLNIQPVIADILHLPFPTNSFDVVVMNGVLEWVGLGIENIDPLEAQNNVLHYVHEILTENGYIYIGIENRYGLDYIFGEADHGGLRFTSLLPRWVADLYSHSVSGEKYRAYTHSCGVYKEMLRDAGFHEVQAYVAFPSYRYPKVITETNNPQILKNHLKRTSDPFDVEFPPQSTWRGVLRSIQHQLRSKALQAVCAVNLLEVFGSHFIFIARKQ